MQKRDGVRYSSPISARDLLVFSFFFVSVLIKQHIEFVTQTTRGTVRSVYKVEWKTIDRGVWERFARRKFIALL